MLGASRPIPSSKTVPPIYLEKTWVWPPVFVANCEVLVINFPFDYIFLLILAYFLHWIARIRCFIHIKHEVFLGNLRSSAMASCQSVNEWLLFSKP